MSGEKKLTGYPSIDKPWLKYYSEEAINAKLPECTMYEYIYNLNQDNLDRIAINYYGTDITYGDFFDNIDKVSGALESIGIKENDIVTVCMINSIEAITLMFALNKIGAVANLIYGVSTEEEIIKYLKDANSKIVFTLDIFRSKFENIIDKADIDRAIVVGSQKETALCKPFTSWNEFMKNQRHTETVSRNPEAVAVITYTGFVHISGRLKRYMLCIANGIQKKVFSLDIEKVLLRHEKVDNCAVVPIPDETINEAPVAYIIPKKEYANDNNLGTELKQHCEGCLQEVYRPIRYIFIEKFPLTKVGKVDYITLAKMAMEE